MCSSWLPTASRSQESPFEISSILHSLAQNRPRLPGPLTFRDEPGPGRSLSNIVSLLSNSIDRDPKAQYENNNLLKSKNDENWSENSRTESAINAPSAASSLSRRERVDLLISQALWSSKDPQIIELHSKNQPIGIKHADLTAESLETFRRLGSVKSFSPNTEHSLQSTTSRSKISQTPKNKKFDEELMKNNLKIFSRRNFFLKNHYSSNSGGNRGLEQVPGLAQNKVNNFVGKSEVNEFFNNKLAAGRRDICEVSNFDRNNSNNGNNIEIFERRSRIKIHKRVKSSHRVNGRRIRKISSSNFFDGCQNKLKVELSTSDTGIILKENPYKSSEDRRDEQKIIIDEKTIERPQKTSVDLKHCSETLAAKSEEGVIDPEPQKYSKLDRIRSRFASGSFLQRQASAKPSKTVIPTSSRARALFRPLAGIQEPEVSKPRIPIKKTPEKSKTSVENLQKRPERQKIVSKSQNGSNARGRPSFKPLSPQRIPQLQKLKEENPKKSQILRSKTFVSTAEVKKIEKKSSELETNAPNSIKTSSDSQESTKKSKKQSQSFRMLQEILSFEQKSPRKPKRTSSRIPTIKSSQNSLKTSRTLLEKLANISDSSIPSTPSSRSFKASRIPSKMIKEFQNLETQTPKTLETSQSLQTVPATKEQVTMFTETEFPLSSADAGVSCDDLDPLLSPQPINNPQINIHKKLVNVEISCNLNPISSAPVPEEKPKENLRSEISSSVKILRVIETQTSRSLLLSYTEDCGRDHRGERNISLGTNKLKLPCKEINTDKRILIDSATGKDRLEIQNFCCDAQMTNTDVQSIYSPINYVMKKDANHQVDAIRSLMNIDVGLTGEFDTCGKIVSSISRELMTSRRCLVESCEKLSSEFIRKQEEIVRIPREVIRAFEIAEDRARNLCRALEIYQESLKRCNERRILGKIGERKSINSEFGTRKDIEKCENLQGKGTREGQGFMEELKTFLMHQEVKVVVEEILKAVERKVSLKGFGKNESSSCRIENSSAEVLVNRGNILPIIYGALCSLVFWSLQFSMSCDLS